MSIGPRFDDGHEHTFVCNVYQNVCMWCGAVEGADGTAALPLVIFHTLPEEDD